MNEQLTEQDRSLLGPPNFAWIVTLNPDGSPQATLTWIGSTETHVLVNTAVGRRKDRNVERDPRVTIAVQQVGDAYRWCSIEGTVEQWMTRDPITVGPEATNGEAAMMMIHGGFRHVPICDHGKLIGIVSIRDLLTLPNESPKGV